LPELHQIDRLLDLSKYGIAFSGKTKEEAGELMKRLHLLEPFDYFMSIMQLLRLLAKSNEFELLHKTPFINKYSVKEQKRNTFIEFLNQYRISQAKRLLLKGKNVSETCYDCGFQSLSYFNRSFKKVTGQNPSEFKTRFSKLPQGKPTKH